MTINDLAKQCYEMFELKTRDNGEKFWVTKEDIVYSESLTESKLRAMCRACHDDMLPNDYSFEFIVDALASIYNHITTDSALGDIEADPYNDDLLKWVSSHHVRQYYCDDALKELAGCKFYFMDIISRAQVREKTMVMETIIEHLTAILTEMEEENEND